ncbi:MAG: DHA2 family efflux MFS transporter permease subunit [Candidatus Tectomicrobia bacterium]|nr:DHA2 family efflux MFS transporter permease subunit [Candidatus Tectomicrobia bacterium]
MTIVRRNLVSRESPYYKWWIATALVIGSMTVGFAERMVEIAIPQIMNGLRVDLDKAQWIRTGPAIARTILGPTVGWMAGIFGSRQLYIVSLIFYIIFSGFAGAAWSFGALVFFLILKNAGGGLRQPLSMAMLYQAFPSHQRGFAMGLYQASFMMAPSLAPIAGGWLVEKFGWRSIFYINIPINILSLLLITLVMPKDDVVEKRERPASVDFIGLFTMGLFLSTFLLGVNNGRTLGWDSPSILALFSVSAISCIVFLFTELKTKDPIVEITVFQNLSFTLSFLTRLFNTGIFMSMNFIFGIFLQRQLGFSPFQAGQRQVPMAFTSGLGALGWGSLSDKIDARGLIALSLVASSITMYFYSKLEVGISLAYIIMLTIFQSMFRSGAQAMMTSLALGTLPVEKATLGTGLNSLAQNLGNTLGVSLITTYVTGREATHLTSLMQAQTMENGTGHAISALQKIFEKAGERPSIARVRSMNFVRNQLVERSTIEAYHDAFRLASLGGIFLIPMVLFIKAKHDVTQIPRRRFGRGMGGVE